MNLVQKCTKICVKIQLKNLEGGRANTGKFCNKVESAIVENDAVLVLGISLCVLHGLMERLLARHLCKSGSDLQEVYGRAKEADKFLMSRQPALKHS